ncbi:hypothetical protein TWF481_009126 [Arthrobotrys musiformis]|uniref:DUF676 domain-containing protein n=1 Tax=Arthrobotrys musiformis TaxID=47236 RepID=A0AAV9W2T4_9PEZI
MDGDAADDEELTYRTALRCKEQFEEYTPNEPPQLVDTLIEDYQQRFLAWSDYMGVFADQAICLDRRLKDRSDIRDIVIRLLDMIELAITEINYRDRNNLSRDEATPMDIDIDPNKQLRNDDDDLLTIDDMVEAIDSSLSQLSSLGATIRKYAAKSASRAERIQRLAKKSDLATFEGLVKTAVDTLYPDARESLRTQLAGSMMESYTNVLYKQSHQKKLNTPRLVQTLSPMPTIGESNIENTISSPDMMESLTISEIPEDLPSGSGFETNDLHQNLTPSNSHGVTQARQYLPSESAPSTLGSLQTKMLRQALGPPSRVKSKYGASSVQLGKVTYPHPSKSSDSSNYGTCEWCLERHPRNLLNDTKWWSAHIDQDFKPYVCISEKCINEKELPRYGTFREWFQHMNTIHSTKWQQEIHKPIFWICSFNHRTEYFDTIEELQKHMSGCYPEAFRARLDTAAKHSHTERPRPRQVCPLCCHNLVLEKRRKKKSRVGPRKRQKSQDTGGNIFVYKSYNVRKYDDHGQKGCLGSDEEEAEAPVVTMARHIASHLQVTMFLTIRLISMRCGEEDDGSFKSTGSNSAIDTKSRSTIDTKVSWSSQMLEGRGENNSDEGKLGYPGVTTSTPSDQDTHDFEVPMTKASITSQFIGSEPQLSHDLQVATKILSEALESPTKNSKKTSRTFRATLIPATTTDEEFRGILIRYLSSDERKATIIEKLVLAPCPTDGGATVNAIFRFQGNFAFMDGAIDNTIYIGSRPEDEYTEVESTFEGLTRLYSIKGEVILDVIAVAGLNAHPYDSWSVATSGDDRVEKMWLQDFLSAEPGIGLHCRTMIYGYNDEVELGSLDINTYAIDFLNALLRVRTKSEERERPLVLMGHSFGGLIISAAFTRASQDKDYQLIYHSTIQIFSFSVPYWGAQSPLKPANAYFNRQFSLALQKAKTRLATFYETTYTPVTTYPEEEITPLKRQAPSLIVPKNSSILGSCGPLEESYVAEGSHITMVKFSSPNNDTYVTITGILRKILETGAREVGRRIGEGKQEHQKRENGTASSILSGHQDSKSKYVHDQMLRVAVYAGLGSIAEQLLSKGANPRMQPRAPEYGVREHISWVFPSYEPDRVPSKYRLLNKRDVSNCINGVLQSDMTAYDIAAKQPDRYFIGLFKAAGWHMHRGQGPADKTDDFNLLGSDDVAYARKFIGLNLGQVRAAE